MHSFNTVQCNPAGIQNRRDAFASGWVMGIALPLHLTCREHRPGTLCLSDDVYSASQKRLDFQ